MSTTLKVSHTPGPWTIRYGSGIDMTIIGQHGTIAELEGPHTVEGMDEHQDEHLANAKLIAAAPELLEALQDAHNFISVLMTKFPILPTDWKDAMAAGLKKMDSAIKKAT